jgi:hypothetical protein
MNPSHHGSDEQVFGAKQQVLGSGGRCVATLAMLARDSNISKPTTRNAIAQAVAIGLLEKTECRS